MRTILGLMVGFCGLVSCGGGGGGGGNGNEGPGTGATPTSFSSEVNGQVATRESGIPFIRFSVGGHQFVPNTNSVGQGETGASHIVFEDGFVDGVSNDGLSTYLLGKYVVTTNDNGQNSLFAGGTFYGVFVDEDEAVAFYDYIKFGDVQSFENAPSGIVTFDDVNYYFVLGTAGQATREFQGTSSLSINTASGELNANFGGVSLSNAAYDAGNITGIVSYNNSGTNLAGSYSGFVGENNTGDLNVTHGGFAADNDEDQALAGAWWGTEILTE